MVGSGTNGATPEETPINNWAKNRECQRTPPGSAGFFILAVRSSVRGKGSFRGMALVTRLDESAPISWMGEFG